MILTIGGREYKLSFGLGFLQEINKLHSAELEGMKTGYGAMTLLQAGKAMNDPLAFLAVIKAGTATLPQKPSNADVEQYINELIEAGTYQETFDELFDELKKSPALKLAMNIQE